jgi:hypothetical protein
VVRRSRKSHEAGEEKVKAPKGLAPAFAAKVGGNPYVVYADLQREDDPTPRILILNFAAKYAARWFIMKLIHNDDWQWVDPIGSRKCILTTGGIRISMFRDDLEMLLDYQPTEAESRWEDEWTEKSVLRFKYGQHEEVRREYVVEEDQDGSSGDSGIKKTKSKGKGPRTPKEPKVKIDKSGYVSANDIAKELKLEGREVRGILRSSDLSKPSVGWMWEKGSKELKQARAVIESGLKTLKKMVKKK